MILKIKPSKQFVVNVGNIRLYFKYVNNRKYRMELCVRKYVLQNVLLEL
jgi:hypothetical protein